MKVLNEHFLFSSLFIIGKARNTQICTWRRCEISSCVCDPNKPLGCLHSWVHHLCILTAIINSVRLRRRLYHDLWGINWIGRCELWVSLSFLHWDDSLSLENSRSRSFGLSTGRVPAQLSTQGLCPPPALSIKFLMMPTLEKEANVLALH